ncbi:MAG: hypothetical protein V7767_14190, partial [Leeuwenhoekiella sp.]
ADDIIVQKSPQIASKLAITEAKTDSQLEENLKPLQPSIDDKVNTLLAQVDLMEQNAQVTDAEIDALLKKAQEDIFKERMYNDQTNTVNANALLMEVESELDQSFREKVFDALKDGFLKAREAIVDRNN